MHVVQIAVEYSYILVSIRNLDKAQESMSDWQCTNRRFCWFSEPGPPSSRGPQARQENHRPTYWRTNNYLASHWDCNSV